VASILPRSTCTVTGSGNNVATMIYIHRSLNANFRCVNVYSRCSQMWSCICAIWLGRLYPLKGFTPTLNIRRILAKTICGLEAADLTYLSIHFTVCLETRHVVACCALLYWFCKSIQVQLYCNILIVMTVWNRRGVFDGRFRRFRSLDDIIT